MPDAAESYLRPGSPEEAVAAHQAHEGAAWLGGGTLVMGTLLGPRPDVLIDLTGAGLAGVDVADGRLRIGAATTIADLARHPALEAPALGALREAAAGMAPPTIRRAATVAGNLCIYVGSLWAPLLLLDASVELVGENGPRRCPLGWMWLQEHELVTAVELPLPPEGLVTGWARLQRTPVGPALVAVAAGVQGDALRIATASAEVPAKRQTPVELRGRGLPAEEVGELVSQALTGAWEDPRGSADYRRAMAGELTRRLLVRLRGDDG